MNPNERYKRWLTKLDHNTSLGTELLAIQQDKSAITDRFWRELAFGTGGLRGVMGAGTNRMNVHTVGKATQGLADYLKSQSSAPTACIAWDTRNMSMEFAHTAADVLCANGIHVYLFEDVRPTPMLSFAVRHCNADAGIVITASHNPKEYNGYKVYGSDGGQITDKMAAAILIKMNAVDVFDGVKKIVGSQSDLLTVIGEDLDAAYFEKVKALSLRPELLQQRAGELRILYSPLHGSGNKPVRRILRELNFSQVDVVPEQEQPDGNFPTAPYPNPEDQAVYALAIKQAEAGNPDLIFATDPDCDRIGVMVRDAAGAFSVLSGNQVGVLLCDYIITARKEQGTLPENPAIIKTIVTTDLATAICSQNSVHLEDTLTGFKYIGEKIGEWEDNRTYSFLFGFEESYGYLSGNFVRDKDAIIAAALIAEMALWYKEQGRTLYQAMEALYQQYGYTAEKLLSVSMPGQAGQEQIAAIIDRLRTGYATAFPGEVLEVFEDYKVSERCYLHLAKMELIPLPSSNVLKFIFSDGSWLVLRPSGTESKIKLYLYATGADKQACSARMAALEALGQGLTK